MVTKKGRVDALMFSQRQRPGRLAMNRSVGEWVGTALVPMRGLCCSMPVVRSRSKIRIGFRPA